MRVFLTVPSGEVKSAVESPSSFPDGFPCRGDGGGKLARAVLDVAELLGDGVGLDSAAEVAVVVSATPECVSILVKKTKEAINHPGKAGSSNIAKFTDNEWSSARKLIADTFAVLNASNIDKTVTGSLSLTSGSLVLFQLTA